MTNPNRIDLLTKLRLQQRTDSPYRSQMGDASISGRCNSSLDATALIAKMYTWIPDGQEVGHDTL